MAVTGRLIMQYAPAAREAVRRLCAARGGPVMFAQSAGCDPSPPPAALRAQVGDMLVTDEGGQAGIPRLGEIIAVPSADGSPPYLVHWLAGEYESTIWPGAGARIEKRRPGRAGPAGPGATASQAVTCRQG